MQLALLLVAVFVAGGIDGGLTRRAKLLDLLRRMEGDDVTTTTTTAPAAEETTVESVPVCNVSTHFECVSSYSQQKDCFPKSYKCDGYYTDCLDGSDETEDCIACEPTDFKCVGIDSRNWECIQSNLTCDYVWDCWNGEDEPNTCPDPANVYIGSTKKRTIVHKLKTLLKRMEGDAVTTAVAPADTKERAIVHKLKTLLKRMEGDAAISAEEQAKRHLGSLLKRLLA